MPSFTIIEFVESCNEIGFRDTLLPMINFYGSKCGCSKDYSLKFSIKNEIFHDGS